jgi:hypothetical protein
VRSIDSERKFGSRGADQIRIPLKEAPSNNLNLLSPAVQASTTPQARASNFSASSNVVAVAEQMKISNFLFVTFLRMNIELGGC